MRRVTRWAVRHVKSNSTPPSRLVHLYSLLTGPVRPVRPARLLEQEAKLYLNWRSFLLPFRPILNLLDLGYFPAYEYTA